MRSWFLGCAGSIQQEAKQPVALMYNPAASFLSTPPLLRGTSRRGDAIRRMVEPDSPLYKQGLSDCEAKHIATWKTDVNSIPCVYFLQ